MTENTTDMSIYFTILLSIFVSSALSADDIETTTAEINEISEVSPSQNRIKFEILRIGASYNSSVRLDLGYKITYGAQVFERIESCRIIDEENEDDDSSIEVQCSGTTSYNKNNDESETVSNIDVYSYGSRGFYHKYRGSSVEGSLNHTLDKKPYTLEVGDTDLEYELEPNFVGDDQLTLKFTLSSKAFISGIFTLVRRENFTVSHSTDENNDLLCDGVAAVVVGFDRDTEDEDYDVDNDYFSFQGENFMSCGKFDFKYVAKNYYEFSDVVKQEYLDINHLR